MMIRTDERVVQEDVMLMEEEAPEFDSHFRGLDCLIELRSVDPFTGIQFRDCLIDYTRCPNHRCIKKLL